MNTKNIFLFLFISGVVVSLLVNHGSSAQSSGTVDTGDVVQSRLVQLYSELSASKQTNTLAQLGSFIAAVNTLHSAKETSLNVVLLERLRSGRTDEAITLLEMQLDGSLMTMGAYTNEIRAAELKTLKMAKDYRARFPHKSGNADVDAFVARAFELLDKKESPH